MPPATNSHSSTLPSSDPTLSSASASSSTPVPSSTRIHFLSFPKGICFLSFPKGICVSLLPFLFPQSKQPPISHKITTEAKNRVPHISLLRCGFPPSPGSLHRNRTWSAGLAVAAIAGGFGFQTSAYAQATPCFVLSRTLNHQQPVYPPIAKAAHVSGVVVTLVTFAQDGSLTDVKLVSGPEMLRSAALKSIQTLRAEPASGTQQCPFSMRFVMATEQESCERNFASQAASEGIQVCAEYVIPIARYESISRPTS